MTERRSHQTHDGSKRTAVTATAVSPTCAKHREATTALAKDEWRVVDDWPDTIPVTSAEIEVLENFLGRLLDEIIGGNHGED